MTDKLHSFEVKRGRPVAWTPSEKDIEKVERLAGLGLTKPQIAAYFGVSHDTLTAREKENEQFCVAIKVGRAKSIAFVANKLFEQASKGNLTAIIFYLKTQANWRETEVLEISGKDDDPIQTQKADAKELLRQAVNKARDKIAAR